MSELTAAQRRLYDEVMADASGRDLREVLRAASGSPEDKATVAEALGGPGAGVEFGR